MISNVKFHYHVNNNMVPSEQEHMQELYHILNTQWIIQLVINRRALAFLLEAVLGIGDISTVVNWVDWKKTCDPAMLILNGVPEYL